MHVGDAIRRWSNSICLFGWCRIDRRVIWLTSCQRLLLFTEHTLSWAAKGPSMLFHTHTPVHILAILHGELRIDHEGKSLTFGLEKSSNRSIPCSAVFTGQWQEKKRSIMAVAMTSGRKVFQINLAWKKVTHSPLLLFSDLPISPVRLLSNMKVTEILVCHMNIRYTLVTT